MRKYKKVARARTKPNHLTDNRKSSLNVKKINFAFIYCQLCFAWVIFFYKPKNLAQMSDQDPTSIINMIKDLRSGAKSYRKSSGVSVRYSGTSYMSSMFDESEESIPPKQQKLDESVTPVSSKNQSDSVPGSPWEWRRLKGEVIYKPI